MAIAMIKKLSTPKIMGKRPRLGEGETEKDLYQVVGIASGVKTGDSDYGPWSALTGTFAAQNLESGEQFRSGVAFLPDVALDPIIGQLNMGVTAVEFGFTIGIKEDDTPVGYVYIATPIVEPDENDPLEELAQNFTEVKLIESPEEVKKRMAAEKNAKLSKERKAAAGEK